jgi:hypothetical protein
MPSNAKYRETYNRRLSHNKRLFSAYKTAIEGVMNRVISSGGNIEAKTIYGMLLPKVKGATLETFKAGVVDSLNQIERIAHRRIPALVQKSKETELCKVNRNDLLALGLPSDKVILQDYAINQVKTMAWSLHGKIGKAFETFLDTGETQEWLIDRLKGIKGQSTFMARRIAQTETTRIYNGGSSLAYEKSQLAKGKEWVSNLTGNPRPWHVEANGQQVGVGEPFVVMDEELMFPGDPSGSPENTINCYCGMMPVIGEV